MQCTCNAHLGIRKRRNITYRQPNLGQVLIEKKKTVPEGEGEAEAERLAQSAETIYNNSIRISENPTLQAEIRETTTCRFSRVRKEAKVG